MKRTVLTLGLAAVAFACCGRLLIAQQAVPAPAQMRVAIVNVGQIFTNYDKAKAFKVQMEKLVEPYKAEAEKLKKEMLAWSDYMKSPKFDPKERDRYESGIRGNQRKLEDMELTVRKLVGKTQEDQIVALFKEVQGEITSYAQTQGIHVVLGYGEQIDGDLYSIANINRKMQGMDIGGCNPLFHAAGIDISQQVVQRLNSNYQRAGGSAPSNVIQTQGTVPSGQK